MKQCDRNRSPFSIGSSSLSFAASESDPEDSFWRDFTFDFSFLTSEDHKNVPDDDHGDSSSPSDLSRHANATTPPKAEDSDPYRPVKNSDSFLNFLESDLKFVDSKLSPSLAVVSTSHFDSNVSNVEERSQKFRPTSSVLGVATSITPMAKNVAVAIDNSGDNEAEGRFHCAKVKDSACSGNFFVRKDIDESSCSPLFSKISALGSSGSGIDNGIVLSEKSCISCDQDETEVDSPCWRGARSHNTAASGTKSLNFRRSSDDLNGLSRLNPLAPQFIPSSAKKNLDKNGKGFVEYSSSSLKRSLSSRFPPSLGEISITDLSEAGIGQGSGQKNRIGILVHDADESLGLVTQDSICKAMSVLDISNEFQTSKKLDPLAPLFVPGSAKLSAVVHEKYGETDHMIATETNAHSTYALSSSDDTLLNYVEAETHSPEVYHSFRKPYSNNVHESGKTFSVNPRLGSQVQISENTKLYNPSNKSHGPKKLNPLAPQFLLADTKPKGYRSEENQASNDLPPKVKSSTLFGFGYGVGHRGSSSASSPSPKMDVKKLLTTIHGLSELLTHERGSETSDSPNEQDLDLINCTVQNLNSYINNRVQEHTGNYASAAHNSCDLNSLPKLSFRDHELAKAQNMTYSMVSGEMVPDSQFEYGVTKENGFGKVIGNHQTEEQINPQVLFYRSLWLKAKADRSLMEYETFLSKTKT